MKIVVEIILGFLGSGKTTFINALIKKTQLKNEKIAIIQWEDGNVEISEINNRVKKYTFSKEVEESENDFLNIIHDYKPHRIFIEYNGTDNINYLFKMVESDLMRRYLKVKCIYTIINANEFSSYIRNMEEIYVPYFENSNLILINNSIKISKDLRVVISKKLVQTNLLSHVIFIDTNEKISEEVFKFKYIGKESFKSILLGLEHLRECRWDFGNHI